MIKAFPDQKYLLGPLLWLSDYSLQWVDSRMENNTTIMIQKLEHNN